MSLRRALASRRLGWALVVVVAVAAAWALGSGRVAATDLPQHAVVVRRILDGTDGTPWQIRWLAPYATFYVLARGFAFATGDAVSAVWAAMAVAAASLPVASAALCSARGRHPGLGVLSVVGAFSISTAWGFGSLVLGASVAAAALAAAHAYAGRPTALRGAVVVVSVLALYATHYFAWAATLPFVVLVVLAGAPRHPRLWWPAGAAAVATGAACAYWLSTVTITRFAAGEATALRTGGGPGLVERAAELPRNLAAYGRAGALDAGWWLLAALCISGVVVTVASRARVWRRAARRRAEARRDRISGPATAFRRGALGVFALACVAGYFALPLDSQGVHLVYPRVLPLLAVAVPACLWARRDVLGAMAVAGALAALAVAHAARGETAWWTSQGRCIDRLAASARDGESVAGLIWDPAADATTTPLRVHLVAEIVARRGGRLAFDFADYGAGVYTYASGWEREVLPSREWSPHLYDHALHGVELTAWLVHAPAVPLELIFRGAESLDVTKCEHWYLVTDRSTSPGGRPASQFLPHRSE